MFRPSIRTAAFTALFVALALVTSACSGGGGGGGGGGGSGTLRVTISDVNQQFAASDGVLGITFQVLGPGSTVYDLIIQFSTPGSAAPVNATQVPLPLANAINAQNPGAGVGQIQTQGLVLPPTDGSATDSFVFWWYAGADLGFLNSEFDFGITPQALNAKIGTSGDSTGLTTYLGGTNASPPGSGLPPQTSTGPGAGVGSGGNPAGGQGRAGHTAEFVRGASGPGGENVAIAGGYNDGTSPNAFDSIDRFDFDSGTFGHSIPTSIMFPGGVSRVLHASSAYIDEATGALKVLVTGGVSNFDPNGNGLANQVSGSTDSATAAVYCFSPAEQVQATNGAMAQSRYMHTSAWVPSNEVVIIGGATGTANPVGVTAIEHYRPSTNNFLLSNASTTSRAGAKAVLMASGNVFIAGGFDPANPTGNVMCEIYNPTLQQTFAVTSQATSFMNRVNHTVTRLNNGWILIVGGQNSTGDLNDTAVVYKPETATNASQSNGVFEQISIGRGRALHAATRLANGQVLVTGGVTPAALVDGGSEFTRLGQVFTLSANSPAGFTSTLIENLLTEARAEHAAPASETGSVFVIGGRNNAFSTSDGGGYGFNFLDSVEFFPFSNNLPVVVLPNTQLGVASGNTLPIAFDVTDAEGDSGYVIVRTRLPGQDWQPANIVAQSLNGGTPSSPANLMVVPGSHVFTWDTTGFSSGAIVEVQIIPVGAVIGSPVSFQRQIP
jgi:hypothetical protein